MKNNKKEKIVILCSFILIGTIESASAMMLRDKGRQALSSSLRVVPINKVSQAHFSISVEHFLNMKLLPAKAEISKYAYIYGRAITAPLVKKEVNYPARNAPIRHVLRQKLYPLKSLHDIYTSEDLNVVQSNTDLYIQRMEQYPKGSWGYKAEKKRLEGRYLTSDLMYSGKRRGLIEKYQHYVLSLIKMYGLELTTQDDVAKLFEQILTQLAFFKDGREKNFFRYCGLNTHAWYNVQMWYPAKSLSLAYALCDPKMPQQYRIPESQFNSMLANCSFRVYEQANWLMSKAYNTFALTEEKMIENARREEQSLNKLMLGDNSGENDERENTQDAISLGQFPFYSEAFAEQIRQIEYERNRMLQQLMSLSDIYYI